MIVSKEKKRRRKRKSKARAVCPERCMYDKDHRTCLLLQFFLNVGLLCETFKSEM